MQFVSPVRQCFAHLCLPPLPPSHRFRKLAELGRAILAKDPNNREIADEMRKLADEQRALDELWAAKNRDLENARALQAFLREADQIDSVSASHEAFLEYNHLGVSAAVCVCIWGVGWDWGLLSASSLCDPCSNNLAGYFAV